MHPLCLAVCIKQTMNRHAWAVSLKPILNLQKTDQHIEDGKMKKVIKENLFRIIIKPQQRLPGTTKIRCTLVAFIHWKVYWPDKVLSEILGSEIVELLRNELHKFSRISLALQNLFRILRQPVPKLQSNHWSIMGHFRNYHFARLGVKGIPGRK